MKTLTIKDLAHTEDMNASAMASVAGGTMKHSKWGPMLSVSSSDLKFNAEQTIGQNQETLVNNGNNVAFVHGITANVKPTQKADNSINFFG